jgi:hypothetical protein
MGHVKLGFKNLDITSNNNFMQTFGISTLTTGFIDIAKLNHRLILSPNPATNFLQLDFARNKDSRIEIFNLFGEKMMDLQPEKEIDISGLPAGIYILKSGEAVARFVKM